MQSAFLIRKQKSWTTFIERRRSFVILNVVFLISNTRKNASTLIFYYWKTINCIKILYLISFKKNTIIPWIWYKIMPNTKYLPDIQNLWHQQENVALNCNKQISKSNIYKSLYLQNKPVEYVFWRDRQENIWM